MKRMSYSLPAVGLAVFLAACAPMTSAVAGDGDNADSLSKQKIMLDPDTGDITQVPSQRDDEKAANTTSSGQQKTLKPSGYTAWTSKDGTQMISTSPAASAKERVIRCPDGSLRMGHATRSDEEGSDTPSKLCDAK